jgi:hypothetical protein
MDQYNFIAFVSIPSARFCKKGEHTINWRYTADDVFESPIVASLYCSFHQCISPIFSLTKNSCFLLKVWSPAGGWWVAPKSWQRNTGVAFAVIGFAVLNLFNISASKERRPIAPYKHIPSQKWCKHAKEDDPSL